MDNLHPAPLVTAGTDFPGPGGRTWRPATELRVGLAVGGGASVLASLLPREPLDRAVTALVGVALLMVAAVLWRRRLTGGPRGLLIRGGTGNRIVPWSAVRALGCGRTKRMGSMTMEIDLVDDELILLGRFELGADPADVVDALQAWFAPHPPGQVGD